MRLRLPALAAALAALALGACGGEEQEAARTQPGAQPAPAQTSEPSGGSARAVMAAEVDIDQFKYDPPEVTVKAGGTVTWTNREQAPHTATTSEGQPAEFDTGTLEMGDSKKVTLSKPGTYTYVCSFHAFMKARVVVTE